MAIIVIRTIIIYTALLLSLRLMGKRQLGELEISELAVAVLIADVASVPLQDVGIPLLNGLLPLLVLLCGEILITGLAWKSVRLRYLLYGRPSVLIRNGQIQQKEMRRNRFTLDELYEELRRQSITDIRTVEQAELETSGELSVVLYPRHQPVTAGQLGIACPEHAAAALLVNDGRIIEENLRAIGRDSAWLSQLFKQCGIESAKQIYVLSVTDTDSVYYARQEDCP